MVNNIYYVYKWYIVDTDEVFYIGKGKGNRVKGKKNSYLNIFEKIRAAYKTDYRIVYEKLTEEKALELEARQMLIRVLEGHHLVNIIHEYYAYSFPDLNEAYIEYKRKRDEIIKLQNQRDLEVFNRKFSPMIKVDENIIHYFGMPKDAIFDSIEERLLRVYFRHFSISPLTDRIDEEIAFIESCGDKVEVMQSKSDAEYIVEVQIPNYKKVLENRALGFKVIHSLNLVEFLNNGHPIEYQSQELVLSLFT